MDRKNLKKTRLLIRLQQYFEDDSVIQVEWLRRLIVCLKVLWLTLRMFVNDRINTRASALTYTTLLATVPILAIVFAIAKGFGFAEHVENLLIENFKGQEEVVTMLMGTVNKYIEHTQSGLFLGIGFVMLTYTIVMLTGSIEAAFNHIWQVKKERSTFRKLTSYFSMLLLMPFLLIFISGFNVFIGTMAKSIEEFVILSKTTQFFIRLIPYGVSSLLMVGLFVCMPNTRVRFSSALIPGVLCGVAFQAFQALYINSQIWVTNYNAIYGSFAAIPMFLIWTQTSWCITLFGAELAFAIQNRNLLGDRLDGRKMSRNDHDFVCLLILSLIGRRFNERHRDVEHYSADELASELKLPIRLINNMLYDLLRLRWIEALDHSKEETERYQLAWDITNTSLDDVIKSFDRDHECIVHIDRKETFKHQWNVYCKVKTAQHERQSQVLVKDLFQ